MNTSINHLSAIKKIIAKLAVIFLKLWSSTLRIRISEEDLINLIGNGNSARIFSFWHNRLFVASAIFKKYFNNHPMCGLISPSRDGAWLSEIYKNFGIKPIRGSSKRGGRRAFLEMLDAISDGNSIAITPDGPRGPKYIVKKGVAKLAYETSLDIIICGIKFSKFWRVNSWDKFYIPKPFSKVHITTDIIAASEYKSKTIEEIQYLIQNKLYKINSNT